MRQANSFWLQVVVSCFNCWVPHAAPHCGAGSKLSDMVLGQGADVLNPAGKGDLSNGFSVTIDNLFTSFSLFVELSKGGIGGLVFIS